MTNQKKSEHTRNSYGIRTEAKDFPVMCVLSFSYVCNARCPNCPYSNSDIRDNYKDALFMPPDTFKKIADECGKFNAWVRISGGGEPMLHPNAVELFEYAKQKGAKVGLITNGSRFTPEIVNRLFEAGLDMLEFSVDASDPEAYKNVRPGLDWDNLVKTVKYSVEIRNDMKANTKIIASGINQEGVDIDKVALFWEPIVDTFQKRKYLTWGINDPSKSADDIAYLPPEDKIPCPFLFERLNIDSRGKVMVCGFDIAANTDMGNIHQKSIREIWLGDEFEYYRKMHLEKRQDEINICRECPDWKYRSWKHNYWKIEKNAEEKRRKKIK